jgi:hypothetical protein
MQRNNIKHGNQPKTEEEIVKRITWEIRAIQEEYGELGVMQ